MKMYFKRSNLFAALVVGLYSVGGVAQDALQPVTVTGTNIKRTEQEGTSPITVITEEDIVRSGATTTLQLMKLVPQMGGDAYNDNPAINSFSRGVANVSLRTLGASSTLILLNGRRVAPAAYANPNTGQSVQYNLNTIPVSAIARVEVFRDGASAVYGSDAMGGVINFITKSDYQGMQVSTRMSGNDDGQYRRKGATAAGGAGSLAADGYNVLFTADIGQQDADRVINRVIPNFVALCNKLVFCSVFTRVGLKNQVGRSDFTLGHTQSDTKGNFSKFSDYWGAGSPSGSRECLFLLPQLDQVLSGQADFFAIHTYDDAGVGFDC